MDELIKIKNKIKATLSNYRFDIKKFRLGMRTVKTGLSVFLVILLFHLMGWEGIQIGALTTVFSLREDFDKSVHFGLSRIVGNSVGGFFAIIFFLIRNLYHSHFLVTLIFVPLLSMLVIMLNVSINNKAGIIGSISAFLIIALSIPVGDTIVYVFARIFETFCGVFIAMIVNTDVDILKKILKRKNM